jgi:transcriptional regulator with PAS, ATPase and Fis domain
MSGISSIQNALAFFEQGTLILDEADSLSLNAQVALLRVLQDKQYRLIGCSIDQQADVRVIAATNADLPDLVRRGKVRSDLYYRLCVFSVHLPPLREHREDLPNFTLRWIAKDKRKSGVC